VSIHCHGEAGLSHAKVDVVFQDLLEVLGEDIEAMTLLLHGAVLATVFGHPLSMHSFDILEFDESRGSGDDSDEGK